MVDLKGEGEMKSKSKEKPRLYGVDKYETIDLNNTE
jgi:hypothetical protein